MVKGSTGNKRRRLRNQFYPPRHGGMTDDERNAVWAIEHSDRAHVRYLAGITEWTDTRHGRFYPPWGGKSHIRNVPELFAAKRIFKAWAGRAAGSTNYSPPITIYFCDRVAELEAENARLRSALE